MSTEQQWLTSSQSMSVTWAQVPWQENYKGSIVTERLVLLRLCSEMYLESPGFCENVFFYFFIFLIVYLLALGLSCGTRTLNSGLWDLVPWSGIEPELSALGEWSLSHWTTREVPKTFTTPLTSALSWCWVGSMRKPRSPPSSWSLHPFPFCSSHHPRPC